MSESTAELPELPEVITIESGPARERWVPLLELADEPEPLRAYLQDGELFGLVNEDGEPLAAILVVNDEIEEHHVAELRAVAVAEHAQGQGVGGRMIETVVDVLRRRGAQTVLVGTASSGVRQLAFYQRCGFRVSSVERDFFTEAKGYPPDLNENGIAIRDMVWMDRRLD